MSNTSRRQQQAWQALHDISVAGRPTAAIVLGAVVIGAIAEVQFTCLGGFSLCLSACAPVQGPALRAFM